MRPSSSGPGGLLFPLKGKGGTRTCPQVDPGVSLDGLQGWRAAPRTGNQLAGRQATLSGRPEPCHLDGGCSGEHRPAGPSGGPARCLNPCWFR